MKIESVKTDEWKRKEERKKEKYRKGNEGRMK